MTARLVAAVAAVAAAVVAIFLTIALRGISTIFDWSGAIIAAAVISAISQIAARETGASNADAGIALFIINTTG